MSPYHTVLIGDEQTPMHTDDFAALCRYLSMFWTTYHIQLLLDQIIHRQVNILFKPLQNIRHRLEATDIKQHEHYILIKISSQHSKLVNMNPWCTVHSSKWITVGNPHTCEMYHWQLTFSENLSLLLQTDHTCSWKLSISVTYFKL